MEKLFKALKEDQVVIYGDILGFKEFIIENYINNNIPQKECNLCCKIDNIVENELSERKANSRNAKGINFIWLSDSFAFVGHKNVFNNLKRDFSDFVSLLWAMGFIFKGACSFGSLYSNKNVMGYPFVEATELEKNSHSPDIIIGKSAYNQIQFSSDEIYINENSQICFDYCYFLLKELLKKKDDGCVFSASSFNCLFEICEKGLQHQDVAVRKKYIYMVNRVISAIEKIKVNNRDINDILNRFKKLL